MSAFPEPAYTTFIREQNKILKESNSQLDFKNRNQVISQRWKDVPNEIKIEKRNERKRLRDEFIEGGGIIPKPGTKADAPRKCSRFSVWQTMRAKELAERRAAGDLSLEVPFGQYAPARGLEWENLSQEEADEVTRLTDQKNSDALAKWEADNVANEINRRKKEQDDKNAVEADAKRRLEVLTSKLQKEQIVYETLLAASETSKSEKLAKLKLVVEKGDKRLDTARSKLDATRAEFESLSVKPKKRSARHATAVESS